ncbi:hypothetical protein ASPCAL14950 [Aspergillus calidoustus]|uniref:Uncharacterized protein n=1 Tax=Aspergillus calidoustus TaxID=454130 RepID=A0A0U5GPB4_ASPCI|nr:hypothetical protein ASPCAL14950 [Aspergillus calidoustus]
MFPTSESSKKRSHTSSVAGDGPASRTRSRSRSISSHVSSASGPGAFPASSPPERPSKVSGAIVTPPQDPFKVPSVGDPKGKAPELPTPTPTMPTIVRRKSAIALPTQPPVTFPTIEPTAAYKGERTRAEKYKATAEEALDKVLSLQEELDYQHTMLRDLSGRLDAQGAREPRDPSPEQPVIPGMAANTSSAPQHQAPANAQPSPEPRTSGSPQPPRQALYGTPLGAHQAYSASPASLVAGFPPSFEPPPVPPRPQPFHQTTTPPLHATSPVQRAPEPPTYNAYANWRPRDAHPNKPLKGESHSEYGPWRYAVDCKFEIDHPLYPNDPCPREDSGGLPHLRADAANRELQTVAQRQNKSVTQYFHRLFILWDQANTLKHDRVKKLKSTLIRSVGTALYIKDHLTVRSVLDDGRKAEEGRLETFHYHPRGGPRKPRPRSPPLLA